MLYTITLQVFRMVKKASRNDPCPCGSGKKYKKCCGQPGMARHTVTILDSAKASNALLGRLNQAVGQWSQKETSSSIKNKIHVGKLSQSNSEEKNTENSAQAQENDLS